MDTVEHIKIKTSTAQLHLIPDSSGIRIPKEQISKRTRKKSNIIFRAGLGRAEVALLSLIAGLTGSTTLLGKKREKRASCLCCQLPVEPANYKTSYIHKVSCSHGCLGRKNRRQRSLADERPLYVGTYGK